MTKTKIKSISSRCFSSFRRISHFYIICMACCFPSI